MAVHEGKVLAWLRAETALLRALELTGSNGQLDGRKDKKLREVAGFCQIVLRWLRPALDRLEEISVIEFSAGKSYVGLVLATLLKELEGKRTKLVGVDWNGALIEKCRGLARDVGLADARFHACRTLEFDSDEEFDLAVALHACDTASDEAIAKGILLGARHIMVVPCCQNQIRGQIKTGHPLTAMSDYGPLRYRLASMLTDALRAQFLHSAGYVVEIQEIGSERLTPKNLCICARRSKRAARYKHCRDKGYRALRALFGIRPKVESFCPGVVADG